MSFFKKSLNSIVGQFEKVLSDLELHVEHKHAEAEEHNQRAARHIEQARDAHADAYEAHTEAERASKIAGNIRDLLAKS